MKKIYYLLSVTIILCLSCNVVAAQAPYKTSVGGSFSAPGVSFKTYLSNNVALQSDLFAKATVVPTFVKNKLKIEGFYLVIALNTNLMYQNKIKDLKNSELFWFIGGGASLGCEPIAVNGQFGANSIIGLEFVFKNAPIAFQIDLRPGYGMLFNSGNELNTVIFIPDRNPWHHFDCLIGFSLRRTFNKKHLE